MSGLGSEESRYSAIFNTFMYLGFTDVDNGDTLAEIVSKLDNIKDQRYLDAHAAQIQILRDAVRDPNLAGTVLCNQSSDSARYNSGTSACVFRSQSGSYYVSYCGTGDGEWIDNGQGMSAVSTKQQEEAAKYFDDMAERFNWGDKDNIIVTGHSKGGNKAQYITLMAEHGALIDTCYSMDGQGFSPEAIAHFEEKYGENYEQVVKKIYGVCGENDYVNRLGISIIHNENMQYVETPIDADDFAGCHEIEQMFRKPDGTYDSALNNATDQGDMSKFADDLSELLMSLPPDQRAAAAITIMQIAEIASEENMIGLDGTSLTPDQLNLFIAKDLPRVILTIIQSESGRKVIMNALTAYAKDNPFTAFLVIIGVVFISPFVIKLGVDIIVIANLIEWGKDLLKSWNDLYKLVNDFCEGFLEKIEEFSGRIYDLLNGRGLHADYSRFSVDLNALEIVQHEIEQQRNELDIIEQQVRQIKEKIDFGLLTKYAVAISLGGNARNINNLENTLGKMESSMKHIHSLYKNNEVRVISSYEGI
ncbi:MAG: DUF2974 domain-containing protein [Hespellia sp.]|nr:DUF2974 domain-containing protein [Hespellia sp.]